MGHLLAFAGFDHAKQEIDGVMARLRAKVGKGTGKALALQARKIACKATTLGGRVEQPLATITPL